MPVRPGAGSLRIAQNRIAEKDFVRGLGLETTPYAAVEVGADNAAADARIGRPAVLKTQTLGYDGKGQVVLDAGDDLLMAWRDTLGSRPAILEAFAPSSARSRWSSRARPTAPRHPSIRSRTAM